MLYSTGQCLGLVSTTAAACDYWREYAASRPHLIPLLSFMLMVILPPSWPSCLTLEAKQL